MLRGGGKKVPLLQYEVSSRKEIVYHPRKIRNPSSMADLTSLAQALSLYTICTSHNHSIFLNGVRSGVCFDCKPQIRPQILRRTLDGGSTTILLKSAPTHASRHPSAAGQPRLPLAWEYVPPHVQRSYPASGAAGTSRLHQQHQVTSTPVSHSSEPHW